MEMSDVMYETARGILEGKKKELVECRKGEGQGQGRGKEAGQEGKGEREGEGEGEEDVISGMCKLCFFWWRGGVK